jgi:hypothetical protein
MLKKQVNSQCLVKRRNIRVQVRYLNTVIPLLVPTYVAFL